MMNPTPSKLALFDLDHTLLPVDSDYEWSQFLVRLGVVDPAWFERRNLHFYEQYKAGTLDIFEFLEFQLGPLAQYPRSQLDEWHSTFMQQVVLPNLRSEAQALVNQHLHAGDLCALVTATNAFVTRPIGQAFGIPHLIATEVEEVDGRFTGKPKGIPSFREGKVARTVDWLQSLGLGLESFESSTFYSDSLNDIPLLEQVTHPVATNPDPTLEQWAKDRGWSVLRLFA